MKTRLRTALWALVGIALLLGAGYGLGNWQARHRLLREGLLVAWCLQRNLDCHDYRTLQSNLRAYAETYLQAYDSLPGSSVLKNGDARDRDKFNYLRSSIRNAQSNEGTGLVEPERELSDSAMKVGAKVRERGER